MNKDNLNYNDVHDAWQQRVKRELGATKLYTAKGYAHDARPQSSSTRYGKTMTNHDKLNFASRTWMKAPEPNSQLQQSYPIAFCRLNQDQRNLKQAAGYMNDGTFTNPSDPNTMQDQGDTRNGQYNFTIDQIPNGELRQYSKALKLKVNPAHNQTFYSFGAKHTNLFDHMKSDKPRKVAISNTITDLKRLNKSVNIRTAYAKDPNCTLNDYTKNISESIFSPGNHGQVKGIRLNNPYTKKAPGKAFYTHIKGLKGTVDGRIGDKRLTLTAKSGQSKGSVRTRPSTARVTKSSNNIKSAQTNTSSKQQGIITYGSLNDTFSRIVHQRNQTSGRSAQQLSMLSDEIKRFSGQRKVIEDDLVSLKSNLTQIQSAFNHGLNSSGAHPRF